MDHQFRNAAFGGFHKQDVLDYLELTAREHREQLQQLQEELAQVQQRYSQLLEQEDAHNAQVKKLEQEAERLQQSGAKTQTELDKALSENAELQVLLAQKETACQQLQEQVDELPPGAEAYAAVKERSAGVELEAHRRAQGILDQAQEEAAQLQEQMKQWLSRVNRQYSDLRSQIDATMSHAANELNKVGGLMEQVSHSLADQDAALDNLEQVFTDCTTAKVPAPMPLSEE